MLIRTMDAWAFVVRQPGILRAEYVSCLRVQACSIDGVLGAFRGKRDPFGKEGRGLFAVGVTLSGHALSPEASGTFSLFIHICACRMCPHFVVKPAL